MKFFLFWLGIGLAGIAQMCLWFAISGQIAWLFVAAAFALPAYFVLWSWAQTHRQRA